MTILPFTSKPEKKYKQAYKQHLDKLYPLHQSKEVHLSGEAYVLLGQKRLRGTPLFSDFDIFNGHGESADEDIGYRVHVFISQLIITQEIINQIKESVAGLVDEDIDESFLREHFSIKNEQEANQLTELTLIHEHMTALIDLVNHFAELESFDETNMNELADKWTTFTTVYEPRADKLLTLYNMQVKEEEMSFEDIRARLLWQEAELVYHLYEMLRLEDAETGTVSINDWIEDNYTYGRFRQTDLPMKKGQRFERGMYTFVIYLYRFIVWLFTPIVLIVLYIDGELTFGSALPLISFAIVGSVVKSQNKASLLNKVHKAILNYRAETDEGTGSKQKA